MCAQLRAHAQIQTFAHLYASVYARYYGPYGAPLDGATFTLQVPVVNDVDLFPTDRNFIKLQADAPARVEHPRDPLRTPELERVAVGTVLQLQCRDARALRFEYSVTTGSSTIASSGWQTPALNATQCQAFPPAVLLPWEITGKAAITVSALAESGEVVCPPTARTFLTYDFPGARSPVCPGMRLHIHIALYSYSSIFMYEYEGMRLHIDFYRE